MDIDRHLTELLDDLQNIVLAGDELMPRWDIDTPNGSTTLLVPLSDDPDFRLTRMNMVATFMAWKHATSFTMVSEIIEPHAMIAVHVGKYGQRGLMRLIGRNPVRIGGDRWLEPNEIPPSLITMLPTKRLDFTPEQIAELESLFGDGGRFDMGSAGKVLH